MLSLLALANSFESSWEFMLKGGVFMIPLGITAFVGIAAIAFKFLSLSRGRVIPDALALKISRYEELETLGQTNTLEHDVEDGSSTLARLASVALRHRGKPQADITLAVEASSREETSRLHAGISVLDIVITVAPLLGLLGTASGLVTIFDGWSDDSDWVTIGIGIAKALNTTILGLAIAVPCVVAHGYFTRRIDVFTARLEALLAELANACQAKVDAEKDSD